MIAQRFRTIGYAFAVGTAGCGLYLISLQVAAERGRLEQVEREIAGTRHDIRMLQTEFGARASMRQLEKWNGEALAMTAPRAVQFLREDVQLASFDPSQLDGNGKLAAPRVVTAAVTVAPNKEEAVPPAPTAPAAATVRYATFTTPVDPPTVRPVAAQPTSGLLRRTSLEVEKAVVAKPPAKAKPVAAASVKPAKADKPKVVAVKPVKAAKSTATVQTATKQKAQ